MRPGESTGYRPKCGIVVSDYDNQIDSDECERVRQNERPGLK